MAEPGAPIPGAALGGALRPPRPSGRGVTRIDVVTIFPGAFPGPLGVGVVGRALEAGLLEVVARDLRDWTSGRHRQVDDAPFGGGAGMVLRPEPVVAAVRELRASSPRPRVILLSPQGPRLTQERVRELAREPRLALVCGRYQGVDERAREEIGEELSVGDFVLSGGEVAAMVVIEAVARLLPGVVGSPLSLAEETFTEHGVEPPLYTRPAVFEGRGVPEVLRGGDPAAIRRWRQAISAERQRGRTRGPGRRAAPAEPAPHQTGGRR